MSRLIFLLEEPSLKAMLEQLLPRVLPKVRFFCITHEGKQDLEKSIPRKLRAWKEPEVRFVVVRDNDGGDCRRLKKRLQRLCERAGRPDTLVRIPCQELEAWYFGEPAVLATAYSQEGLARLGARARFRDPDAIVNPSAELERLVPEFQKIAGARRMGASLSATGNRSRSFQVFLAGVRLAGMSG